MYLQCNIEELSRIIFFRRKAINIAFLCLCARTCIYPSKCAYACARARIALLIQHVTHISHTVTSFVASLAPPDLSTLSHKRHNFRKKNC
jgi:hypothetical protein